MLTRQRQRQIAERVSAQGSVGVQDLALHYNVSAETIRRDLAALEKVGLVERTHGGAVAANDHIERSLAARSTEFLEAKEQIALLAARYLPPPGGSLLIDAGSTTSVFTSHIPDSLLSGPEALTIFTNSAPIASALAAAGATDLHMVGGHIRGATGAAVGHHTEYRLSPLRVDVAVLGTNGVHRDRGFTTPDPAEAAAKAAMVRCARTAIMLADSSKFNRDYTVSFAALADVDVLVCNEAPTGELAQNLSSSNVEVDTP